MKNHRTEGWRRCRARPRMRARSISDHLSGLPRAREIVVARPRDARSVTRIADRAARTLTQAGGFPLRVVCAIHRPCAVHSRWRASARDQRRSYRAARSGYQRARGVAEEERLPNDRSTVVPNTAPAARPFLVLPRRALRFPVYSRARLARGFFLPSSLSRLPGIRVCIPLCRGPRHTEAAASRHRAPLLSPAHRRWPKPRPDGGEARARPRAAESWAPLSGSRARCIDPPGSRRPRGRNAATSQERHARGRVRALGDARVPRRDVSPPAPCPWLFARETLLPLARPRVVSRELAGERARTCNVQRESCRRPSPIEGARSPSRARWSRAVAHLLCRPSSSRVLRAVNSVGPANRAASFSLLSHLSSLIFLLLKVPLLQAPTAARVAQSRIYVNDPSAGSPTETLLRLLLPLNDQVWSSSR